jgi:hypothetical protein
VFLDNYTIFPDIFPTISPNFIQNFPNISPKFLQLFSKISPTFQPPTHVLPTSPGDETARLKFARPAASFGAVGAPGVAKGAATSMEWLVVWTIFYFPP